jgi:BTB/POZ domain-containing protein 16
MAPFSVRRLFVLSEFSVFRTLAYWLFLQLNPDLQLMPSHSTVLSYFNWSVERLHL